MTVIDFPMAVADIAVAANPAPADSIERRLILVFPVILIIPELDGRLDLLSIVHMMDVC